MIHMQNEQNLRTAFIVETPSLLWTVSAQFVVYILGIKWTQWGIAFVYLKVIPTGLTDLGQIL